jgi:hypothetical protein
MPHSHITGILRLKRYKLLDYPRLLHLYDLPPTSKTSTGAVFCTHVVDNLKTIT